MTARAGEHRRGSERPGRGLGWVFVCVSSGGAFSPATLAELSRADGGRDWGSGVECEHQDSQGSVYKVCRADFHCYSNYQPSFSHTSSLHWLYI